MSLKFGESFGDMDMTFLVCKLHSKSAGCINGNVFFDEDVKLLDSCRLSKYNISKNTLYFIIDRQNDPQLRIKA